LPESAIVLAGARDFDDDEARRLRDSDIKHLPAEEIASGDALDGAIAALEPQPSALYLHVDPDVLDPEQEAPANIYSAPGGITAGQPAARVEQVLRTGSVRAVALTAYDPRFDAEGRVPPSPTGCSEPSRRSLRETTGYLTRTRKRRAFTASRAAPRRRLDGS
jgi:arginase